MKKTAILCGILLGASMLSYGESHSPKDSLLNNIFGERVQIHKRLNITSEWQVLDLIEPINDGGRIKVCF